MSIAKSKARRTSLALAWLACCCAVAEATSPDRSVPRELQVLVGAVTLWTQRGLEDEAAFFDALFEIIPASREQYRISLRDRLDGSAFQRRFYFGPRASRQGVKPQVRSFAVTASGGWGRVMAFCADTTPVVCVRRDGFEPHVSAGRCDDPRCEVFARGEQLPQASALFPGR